MASRLACAYPDCRRQWCSGRAGHQLRPGSGGACLARRIAPESTLLQLHSRDALTRRLPASSVCKEPGRVGIHQPTHLLVLGIWVGAILEQQPHQVNAAALERNEKQALARLPCNRRARGEENRGACNPLQKRRPCTCARVCALRR